MQPGHRPSRQIPISPGGAAQGIFKGQHSPRESSAVAGSRHTPHQGTNTHPPTVKHDRVFAQACTRVYTQAHTQGSCADAGIPTHATAGATECPRKQHRNWDTELRNVPLLASHGRGRMQSPVARRAVPGPLRQQRDDGELVAVYCLGSCPTTWKLPFQNTGSVQRTAM